MGCRQLTVPLRPRPLPHPVVGHLPLAASRCRRYPLRTSGRPARLARPFPVRTARQHRRLGPALPAGYLRCPGHVFPCRFHHAPPLHAVLHRLALEALLAPLAAPMRASAVPSRPASADTSQIGSGPAAKLVHQAKDAFADPEQLLPRLRNHRLRQKLLRRDCLQSGL